MIRNTKALALASLVLAGAVALPAMAQEARPGRQKDKNNNRNIAIGLGAAAAHQAITGKGTNALVLGAGAAYAGKKYEDARKAQTRENKITRKYVYKNGRRVGYYRIQNRKRLGYVSLRG